MRRAPDRGAMPTHKQIQARNRLIIANLGGGMTQKEAEAKYGLTAERIRQIARQHGVRAKSGIGEAKRKLNQAIIEDLKAGMTQKEAGAKYDLAPEQIYQIARQHGVRAKSGIGEAKRKRNQAIIEDLKAGMTQKEIGAKYRLTAERIRQITKQHGITKYLTGEAKRKRNQAIIKDLKAGMTVKQAGAKYGLHPGSISQIAKQNGVGGIEARRKRNQAIIKDLKAGMTVKQAGAKYGLHTGSISQIARTNGVQAYKAKTRLIGEALRKRNQTVIEDLKAGMTQKEAGAKYGRTPEHINLIARQHGIRTYKAKTHQIREALRKRNQAIITDLKAGMARKEAEPNTTSTARPSARSRYRTALEQWRQSGSATRRLSKT